MAKRKRTQGDQDEYVLAHFGIHSESLGVQNVWETKGGTLRANGRSHSVSVGRTANHELVATFLLSHIKSIPFDLFEAHSAAITADLEQKAEILSEEREATGPQATEKKRS